MTSLAALAPTTQAATLFSHRNGSEKSPATGSKSLSETPGKGARGRNDEQGAQPSSDPLSLFANLIDEIEAASSAPPSKGIAQGTKLIAPAPETFANELNGIQSGQEMKTPDADTTAAVSIIRATPETGDKSEIQGNPGQLTKLPALKVIPATGNGPRPVKQERRSQPARADSAGRIDAVLASVVTEAILLKPRKAIAATDAEASSRNPAGTGATSEHTNQNPEVLEAQAALEIRLHPKTQSAQGNDGSKSDLKPEAKTVDAVTGNETSSLMAMSPRHSSESPVTPKSVRETEDAPEVSAEKKISAPALAAPSISEEIPVTPAAVRQQPAPEPARAEPLPAAKPAAELAEPEVQRGKPQQSLSSLALEFTPDGAADVRVRVAERGGSVHISVHSPDDSLNGRLREGVHDLVGNLASAGYDADAWTPEHGSNHQRPRQDPEQGRNRRQYKSGAADFGGLIDQPLQEVV